MAIRNWRLSSNKSVIDLLTREENINVVILYQNDIERANFAHGFKNRLGDLIAGQSLWTIKLKNENLIKLVPLQRSQIDLKGYTISLLLFPDSVEYNVKNQITRELYPQFIRDGGIVGTLRL